VILDDHIDRIIQDRIQSLQQIRNPQFQQLLQTGEKNPINLENIINTTEFILAYPQHIAPRDANNLIIECLTKLDQEKQVFVKLGGRYYFDYLINNLKIFSKDNK
jgi:hypothetical protein